MIDTTEFFSLLYKNCTDGDIEVRVFTDDRNKIKFFKRDDYKSINNFCKLNLKNDIYYGVALREDGGKKLNIKEIPALFVDVDSKDLSVSEIGGILLEQPSIIVDSGNGYHLYWILKEPATQNIIGRYEETNRKIISAVGGDLPIYDASRILRIPGTTNTKDGLNKECSIVDLNDQEYSLSDFDYLSDVKSKYVPSMTIKNDQIDKVMKCMFLQYCRNNAVKLSEPAWYAMISQLCRIVGGVDKIHEISKPYPKYSRNETDKKILHASNNTGPMTCDRIKEIWDCGRDCGVKSPYSLSIYSKPNVPIKSNSYENINTTTAGKVRQYLMEEFSGGVFKVSDLRRELSLGEKEYALARNCIERMVSQGLIQKHGHVLGMYRVVDKKKNVIVWDSIESKRSGLKLPCGLHDIVTIREGDMICIAGYKNNNKTAMATEIVRLNLDRFKVHFFITEYQARMKKRIMDFNIDLNHPNLKCYPIDIGDYIPDKIESGGGVLNIIDHFPNFDNFYLIGKYQDEISRALNGGLCVVTHQKNSPDALDATGGSFWTITPTLAVTLLGDGDVQTMLIRKGKEPGSGILDATNMKLEYQLKNGCKFECDTNGWR